METSSKNTLDYPLGFDLLSAIDLAKSFIPDIMISGRKSERGYEIIVNDEKSGMRQVFEIVKGLYDPCVDEDVALIQELFFETVMLVAGESAPWE